MANITVTAWDGTDTRVQEGNVNSPYRTIVFQVSDADVEGGIYQGTVSIPVEGFTRQKAKLAVEVAVRAYFDAKPQKYQWSMEL